MDDKQKYDSFDHRLWKKMIRASSSVGFVQRNGEITNKQKTPSASREKSVREISELDRVSIHRLIARFSLYARQGLPTSLFECLCTDTRMFFMNNPIPAMKAISELSSPLFVKRGSTTIRQIQSYGIGVKCGITIYIDHDIQDFYLFLIKEDGYWRITTSDRISPVG